MMNTQQIEESVNLALFAAIASLIPMYFKIAKGLLFVLAIVFALVIVGVMLSSKVLICALKLVNAMSQQSHKAAEARTA